ncbi:hypothetical protein [Streptomyces sp. NPDC048603]|uniref:hypothetical protein n=1 Tax=Streptomyces sp. NPDC048603 TaxID=3365577 RepID=UPI0037197B78
MTETLTPPTSPPEEAAPPVNPPAPKQQQVPEVEHTAGGLPVLPLGLAGTNTTAGLVGAAGMAAGPVAAAVAMTAAVVLGTLATRTKQDKRKPSTRRARPTGAGTPGRSSRAAGLVPSQPRGSHRAAPPTGGGRRTAMGGAAGRSGASTRKNAGGSLRPSAAPTGKVKASSRRVGSGVLSRLPGGGRAGRVAELRQQARQDAPTWAARRATATAARRQVADARRSARAAARTTRPTGSGGSSGASGARTTRGPVGRLTAGAAGKAAAVRDRAVAGGRKARDRHAAGQVRAGEHAVRQAARAKRVAALKAPAQKAARKALRRSAARYQARRAVAGVLGALLGTAGMLTTPLGRKLHAAWLMNPGQRLFRWLTGRARAEREQRDAEITARLGQDETAAEEQAAAEAEQDEQPLGDRAARPGSPGTTTPPVTSEGDTVSSTSSSSASGFRFEELAAEMEQAAQSYEPESAMEILAMVDGLPEALASIANIMQILAERSDSEFPLEKEVAQGFADIYGALNSATAVADDLCGIFRMAHEHDIARHEDPRNGPEAEKGWNV